MCSSDLAVSSYYDEILNSMYFKTVNKDELYKIIEPRIVDFSLEVMKEIQNRLSVKITEQSILVLAFHLKFLIDRLRKIKLTESKIGRTSCRERVCQYV